MASAVAGCLSMAAMLFTFFITCSVAATESGEYHFGAVRSEY